MSDPTFDVNDGMISKCSECDDYDPRSIASCPHCNKAVCDGCFFLRHEDHKCRKPTINYLERIQFRTALVLAALNGAIEWMSDDGCDCGGGDDPECALCLCRAALKEMTPEGR